MCGGSVRWTMVGCRVGLVVRGKWWWEWLGRMMQEQTRRRYTAEEKRKEEEEEREGMGRGE